jgi:hypothetical protein
MDTKLGQQLVQENLKILMLSATTRDFKFWELMIARP